MHLNICSRRNKQTTFSGQEKTGGLSGQGLEFQNHIVFLCLNVVFISENVADPD